MINLTENCEFLNSKKHYFKINVSYGKHVNIFDHFLHFAKKKNPQHCEIEIMHVLPNIRTFKQERSFHLKKLRCSSFY